MSETFENASEVRLTVYPDKLKAKGVEDIRQGINGTLKGVNIQVEGDEISIKGTNLRVGTDTGGKVMVTTDKGEIIIGSGYYFTKKVVVDGREVWKNRDEKK